MSALLGACASVSPGYSTSAANRAVLTKINSGTVAVGQFTQPSDISTMCRGNGPVDPPKGMTFASFVQDALMQEIKASGKLATAAPDVTLTGKLTKVDFSSSYHLVHGYWDLALDLHSSNGKSLTAAEHYEFDSGFIATTACDNSANALPIAVQKLIHQVVTSPEFPPLLVKK